MMGRQTFIHVGRKMVYFVHWRKNLSLKGSAFIYIMGIHFFLLEEESEFIGDTTVKEVKYPAVISRT